VFDPDYVVAGEVESVGRQRDERILLQAGSEDVAIALLVDEDASRVLAPAVDTVLVATHTPIHLIVHQTVGTRLEARRIEDD
jgi:hypothetical protein